MTLHITTKRSKLAKVMETKGFKILRNIKTKWINIVALSKVVLEEFLILLVKMVKDVVVNESTTTNYELLCNIENILGLIYPLPMLEVHFNL
jgi:hypothetical protein